MHQSTGELRQSIGEVREELRQTAGELRQSVGGVGDELHQVAGELRGEMRQLREDTERRFTWLVGIMVTRFLAVIGTMAGAFWSLLQFVQSIPR